MTCFPAIASVTPMVFCTSVIAVFFLSAPDLCPKSPSTTCVIAGPPAGGAAYMPPGTVRNDAAITTSRQKNRPVGRHALRIFCAFPLSLFTPDSPGFVLTTGYWQLLFSRRLIAPHEILHALHIHIGKIHHVALLFNFPHRIQQ